MQRYTLLTPGPTPVPDSIRPILSEPLLHHRTPEFAAILRSVFARLGYVFQTKSAETIILSSSGTGALEAAVVNFFSPGDKVIVCDTGSFGARWAAIARVYGLDVSVHKQPWGHCVDVDALRREATAIKGLKGVFVTHAETSAATVNPVKEAGVVAKANGALYLVDAVSSLAGEELRQDDWGVDVCVSASQKGLMCPPGLALLSISEAAWMRTKSATCPRYYWNLQAYRKAKAVPELPFTPPISLLGALDLALGMIEKETMEVCWKRFAEMAVYVRGRLTKEFGCKLLSLAPSNVVTGVYLPEAIKAAGVDSSAILKYLRDEHKVTIADGQEDMKGKIFRFAHMGAIGRAELDIGFSALKQAFVRFSAHASR